jgi:hypothetical protein
MDTKCDVTFELWMYAAMHFAMDWLPLLRSFVVAKQLHN